MASVAGSKACMMTPEFVDILKAKRRRPEDCAQAKIDNKPSEKREDSSAPSPSPS
ncbi:MAG: hypothetical protein ABIA47_00430 [bacterium]